MRWRSLYVLMSALLWMMPAAQAASPCKADWPAWKQYKQQMMDGGRVIDRYQSEGLTTSEGQSYALFFALVANDRATFEKILDWTENNLAHGDFSSHLPAWQWGKRDDQTWGVLDDNAASDADLWIAYTLGQAGRLWQVRRYRALSQLIAHRILSDESADIPGLGRTLLPAPVGFTPEEGLWRLNASYLPLQLFRGLAQTDPKSPWLQFLESSYRVIEGSSPKGFAADWVQYDAKRGFVPDQQTEMLGSYNAIRVYLWAGMLDVSDPYRKRLMQRLQPMLDAARDQGTPPESVNTLTTDMQRKGPPGFSAALLPLLKVSRQSQSLKTQLLRLRTEPADPQAYYDQSLSLFGQGWLEGQYRFTRDGMLRPRWSESCTRV